MLVFNPFFYVVISAGGLPIDFSDGVFLGEEKDCVND